MCYFLRISIISVVSMWGMYSVVGQNLVPNPSFEDYVTCPNGFSKFGKEGAVVYNTDWFNPGKSPCNTPDWFHVCGTGTGSIPTAQFGPQDPLTGSAYGSFFAMGVDSGENYREYIEVQLVSPLQIGEAYEVEFFLSLGDRFGNFATDAIGAVFSVDTLRQPDCVDNQSFVINAVPQIANKENSFIDDRNGWLRVSGSFVSDSLYQFMTIGNFKTDANTNLVPVLPETPSQLAACHYFIDDVSVTPVEDEFELYVPTAFTPDGDSINDVFYPKHTGINDEAFVLMVLDRWGEILFETSNVNLGWDGSYKGIKAAQGMYIWSVEYKDQNDNWIKQQGKVHLIR